MRCYLGGQRQVLIDQPMNVLTLQEPLENQEECEVAMIDELRRLGQPERLPPEACRGR